MTKYPKFLTRKDIATIVECSVFMVRMNETALGLKPARRDLNTRVVRYLSSLAIPALKSRGYLEPEISQTVSHGLQSKPS